MSHHQQIFGCTPQLVAGDRVVHSAGTEESPPAVRVKVVSIPAADKLSEAPRALERTL